MTTHEELYAELKPDVAATAEPLMDFAAMCIRKRGNFLPVGAVLSNSGEAALIAAGADGTDMTSSTEVLPAVHDAIRARANEEELLAVAVVEDVTVEFEGAKPTRAIKVLVEHRRELVVAVYLPFRKRLLFGHSFGEVCLLPAEAEVRAWGGQAG